jgi:hypothetical protein
MVHALTITRSFLQPQRADFDPAEAGHGVPRGDFDRLVEVPAFEKVEACDPFLLSANGPSVTSTLPLRRHTVVAFSGPLRRLPRSRTFRRSISATHSSMLSSSGTYVSPAGSTQTNMM